MCERACVHVRHLLMWDEPEVGREVPQLGAKHWDTTFPQLYVPAPRSPRILIKILSFQSLRKVYLSK